MASFNQVPTGQSSLVLSTFSLILGSAANTATVFFSSNAILTDGSGGGDSLSFVPPPAAPPGIYPSWRRSLRVITGQ